MRKCGIIYLFYRDGDLVSGRQYSSLEHRHEIIAYWKRMYAAAYGNCFLQIAPEANLLCIDRRGLNTRKVY